MCERWFQDKGKMAPTPLSLMKLNAAKRRNAGGRASSNFRERRYGDEEAIPRTPQQLAVTSGLDSEVRRNELAGAAAKAKSRHAKFSAWLRRVLGKRDAGSKLRSDPDQKENVQRPGRDDMSLDNEAEKSVHSLQQTPDSKVFEQREDGPNLQRRDDCCLMENSELPFPEAGLPMIRLPSCCAEEFVEVNPNEIPFPEVEASRLDDCSHVEEIQPATEVKQLNKEQTPSVKWTMVKNLIDHNFRVKFFEQEQTVRRSAINSELDLRDKMFSMKVNRRTARHDWLRGKYKKG